MAVEFSRAPLASMDGIDVFLLSEVVAVSDEYREQNPYRDERTKETVWDRSRTTMIAEAVAGTDLLDVGCGEGELSAALAAKHRVEGLDHSVAAVRSARARVPNAHFVVADAQDLPYADGQFDTVVLANIFEHVEAPCLLLREARRVLKPQGRLVMSTPSRYKTANFRRAMTGRRLVLNSPNHVTEYTCGQVGEILRWCGFALVSSDSNLRCRTRFGTAAARLMQFGARVLGSHTQFGDPTVYVADRVG
jgi:2-polyprenyl-3-methyl-5-hydroxy-6-metoxy-1,4-benzoquinol methylase